MDKIIDLRTDDSISLIHYKLQTPFVNLGEDLIFSFTLQNTSEKPVPVDIRYRIECPDGKGWRYRTYKISSRKCPVGFLLYNRSHTLFPDSIFINPVPASSMEIDDTGAVSHRLPCRLHILVNGQVLKTWDFELCL